MSDAQDSSRVELSPTVLPVAVDGVLSVREGRHAVSYRLPIPYFGFLWAPLVSRRAREIGTLRVLAFF